MFNRINYTKVAAVCVALLWLGGCVQTKPTPGYARAGDHITVGLGGIIRNAGGEAVLKKSDLVITLTDANSQQFNLEPRFIFKSYIDYSAQMNTFTFDGTNQAVGLTGMVPYDGGWMVVIPLTYPQQYSSPLPLAVGPATISVSSPSNKLVNTADSVEGDLSSVPLEIIAGTSAQDVDFVRQFGAYNTTPNSFVVSPDTLAGITEVGGAFFAINYNDDTFFTNGLEPVVVPSNHNPYVQLNYNVVSNGDGTGTIFVTLLNPAGFKTLVTASPNSSFLADLSVRLNYFSGGTPAAAKANFSVDTFNSYYIGMNGAVIPGVEPVLTHAIDL
tara:strand:+ start:228 stop:1214 length:987 start_codon:yes stop_codon:yes gene_type:complete